jgi:2-methylcitrate dehydratase PrpD
MNKRQFLSRFGLSSVAFLETSVNAQQKDLSAESEFLSLYMAQAGQTKLTPNVEEQTKYHLLDTYAAIISGSQLLPGKAAMSYIQKYAPPGKCTILGSKLTASAADAALANGVMAHADETDDSHNRSRSHPGCSVVPAATASGEIFKISGNHLLRAVALGYDVGTRVVMAMGGPEFSYSSHKSSHSIAGIFGAASATACAARLNQQQMRWVMDYTAQQSSGIYAWGRDTDHIEKAFVFAGMPSKNGVTSALLVENGWNGINDIFSGPDNFFEAYAPLANKKLLTDGLGERFEITQTDIKKWTVGSPIQGPLDALELIRQKNRFDTQSIQKVLVHLEPSTAKVVSNREMPDICLQHMVAVMLLDGTASFKAAHDIQRMKDASVLEQRAKVELIFDDELKQFMPVRVAVVEVILKDGTRYSERVEAVRGTPRNPMSRQEVIDKALDLIGPVLGSQQAKDLSKLVLGIEAQPDLGKLIYLLKNNA